MPYPENPFDDTTLVQETIPSFWTDVYGGRDLIYDMIRGATVQERQLDQTARELFDSMGRLTCPVYHTDLWLPVDIREDEGASASLLTYGTGLVYGVQPATGLSYVYGGSADASWQFPLPVDVIDAQILTDDIVEHTVALAANLEFRIVPRSGFLIFAQNPFFDPRFTPYTDSDGVRKLRLYLFAAQRDWRYLANLYGCVIGDKADSSLAYKDFINAIMDGVTTGTAMSHIYGAYTAMTGIPFAAGDEVVEAVTADATHQLVLTTNHVYKLPLNATPTVAVGDVLSPFQPLTDVVRIDEVNAEIPEDLTALTLDVDMLAPGIGPLTFTNAEVDLVVTENVDGYTKVEFELGGDSEDVAAFFDEMHARGVAAGTTLANLLDIRANPTTQPAAINLPATINPLKFLVENVVRGSLCLVRVKTAELGDGIGLTHEFAVRTIMPPHAALITIEE